jgi:hypothetical protein
VKIAIPLTLECLLFREVELSRNRTFPDEGTAIEFMIRNSTIPNGRDNQDRYSIALKHFISTLDGRFKLESGGLGNRLLRPVQVSRLDADDLPIGSFAENNRALRCVRVDHST